MSIVKEFKAFAMRGNVIDMAVGIVIGAAFGKIVSSFVENIVMPPLGLIIGGVDFKDLSVTLKEAVGEAPAVVLGYGAFIQTVFDFTIIAFAIFMALKAINTLKAIGEKEKAAEEAAAAAAAPPPPAPKEEVLLLTEIRDLLKK